MIINKAANVIYKIWSSADKSDEAKGLDYEKKVYMEKIKPILTKNPDLPLLPYIYYSEMTVQKLEELIYVPSQEGKKGKKPSQEERKRIYLEMKGKNLFRLAMLIFLRRPNRSDVKWDKEFFEEWKNKFKINHMSSVYSTQELKNILANNIKILVLPTVKFRRLYDCLTVFSSDEMKTVIKTIVEGISYMYKNGLVHNDLHAGNIMIEDNTNKVFIFDWDRAYMKGIKNPLLSRDRCSELCSYSQCNIYNENGYAIDIYKILHYILTERRHIDSRLLLNDLFDIQNTWGERNKVELILNTLTYNSFFTRSENGSFCTFLQTPDKDMQYVMNNFGNISIILANSNLSIRNSKLDSKNWQIFKMVVGVLVTAVTTVGAVRLFGFININLIK